VSIPIGDCCRNPLWPDGVVGRFFEEVKDVVVVYFHVGDEDPVAAVLVHALRHARLLWIHHVGELGVLLLPERETDTHTHTHTHTVDVRELMKNHHGAPEVSRSALPGGGCLGYRWQVVLPLALQHGVNLTLNIQAISIVSLKNLGGGGI